MAMLSAEQKRCHQHSSELAAARNRFDAQRLEAAQDMVLHFDTRRGHGLTNMTGLSEVAQRVAHVARGTSDRDVRRDLPLASRRHLQRRRPPRDGRQLAGRAAMEALLPLFRDQLDGATQGGLGAMCAVPLFRRSASVVKRCGRGLAEADVQTLEIDPHIDHPRPRWRSTSPQRHRRRRRLVGGSAPGPDLEAALLLRRVSVECVSVLARQALRPDHNCTMYCRAPTLRYQCGGNAHPSGTLNP
jgi:hypothetical protein